MNDRIAIIGTGNMGGALLKGIGNANFTPSENIHLFDANTDKAKTLAHQSGATYCKTLKDAVTKCNVIIMAVKPNMVSQVAENIAKDLNKGTVVCSIAVGVPIAEYRKYIPNEYDLFRIMPNTPALVGEGMSIISFEEGTSQISVDKVLKIFSCVGKTEVMDEKLMNQVTALTGSSPAYVYMMIEAMGNAAIKSGIPADICYKLAAQAVLGTSKMVLETGTHPAILKDQVCSPAGTTIAAVESLEKSGFRYSLMEAMEQCINRANEISSEKK